MVCRQCGRIFDLDILPVDDADIAAAANQGFQVDSGDLVLHGLCADCQAREHDTASKTTAPEQRTAA
jgi:Fe2+ or Zn2+ uptake regulation protein